MTDLADAVAQAEDRSFALVTPADLRELVDVSLVFDGTRWTFPKNSTEGESE